MFRLRRGRVSSLLLILPQSVTNYFVTAIGEQNAPMLKRRLAATARRKAIWSRTVPISLLWFAPTVVKKVQLVGSNFRKLMNFG